MQPLFEDREDAARQLGERLMNWRNQHPLILAIPRGALPMGAVLADMLQGDLDVILVHKLVREWDPEYALAAVDEAGHVIVQPGAPADIDLSQLESQKQFELGRLQARRQRYESISARKEIAGRKVIIVDDGLATGTTMASALQSARLQHPAHLCCAVPVAAPESLALIAPLADSVVCLYQPYPFRAVSLHYRKFGQVEDVEAERFLAQAAKKASWR